MVVAIRRGHERLAGGLGNIELHAGDTLVVVPEKTSTVKSSSLIVSLFGQWAGRPVLGSIAQKSLTVLFGFMMVIAAALLNVLPIIKGLAAYLVVLIATGVVTFAEL